MKTVGSVSVKRHSTAILRAVRLIAIIALVVTVCGYLDLFAHAFDYLEQESYGDRLKVASLISPNLVKEAQKQICVIAISDNTYQWAAHGGPQPEVIPRSDQARLIRRLTQFGAKVIVFDVLFNAKGRPDDAQFAEAIRKSGRVVLGCQIESAENRVMVTKPAAEFLAAGCRIGHTLVPLLPGSPAIDRVQPVIEDTENRDQIPALSVEAVRIANGQADLPLRKTREGWSIPGAPLLIDSTGAFKIRYLYASSGPVFAPIPFEQVAGDAASAEAFRADIRDKVVLVGDTRANIDNHLTPVGSMPGVMVHAQAIATLLIRKYIREASPSAEIGVMMGLSLVAALLASTMTMSNAALLIAAIFPAFLMANTWLFAERDYDVQIVAPAAAIFLTTLGVFIERALTEESEKSRMRGLLRRYVSPRMADYILKHPDLVGGSGKRALGTILFSDIRGFTALSEQLPPEELVARMNEYFHAMTEIVMRHDGTAVAIVGDAMLAAFGIPVFHKSHALQAIAAAIEMKAAVSGLRNRWKLPAGDQFAAGIGIHTGEVVIGEIGGKFFTNFTVFGLQVNVASRVEALNKQLGTNILITISTYDIVRSDVLVRGPHSAFVKGVTEPVEVYELVGWCHTQTGPEKPAVI